MTKKTLEDMMPRLVERLKEEKVRLETDMGTIGQRASGGAAGWEATAGSIQVDPADENEVADKLEELEENTGIITQLEKQLTEVNAALDRMEKGTYGICETCGKPIEPERLYANPSARISLTHGH